MPYRRTLATRSARQASNVKKWDLNPHEVVTCATRFSNLAYFFTGIDTQVSPIPAPSCPGNVLSVALTLPSGIGPLDKGYSALVITR